MHFREWRPHIASPSGFSLDKKTEGVTVPHVNLENLLAYRAALQRIDDGQSKHRVVNETGLDRRTLDNSTIIDNVLYRFDEST